MLGFRLKIQQDAMSQHRRRDRAHVFARNVVTAAQYARALPPRTETARRAEMRPTSPSC